MEDLQKEINSLLEDLQKEISSLLEKNFSKEEAIEILLSTFTPILAHIVKRNGDCLQFRKEEALLLANYIIELDRMEKELSRKKIGISR